MDDHQEYSSPPPLLPPPPSSTTTINNHNQNNNLMGPFLFTSDHQIHHLLQSLNSNLAPNFLLQQPPPQGTSANIDHHHMVGLFPATSVNDVNSQILPVPGTGSTLPLNVSENQVESIMIRGDKERRLTRTSKNRKKSSSSSSSSMVSTPRVVFQTRSSDDVLDDGFRWRKYGQKALMKESTIIPVRSSWRLLLLFSSKSSSSPGSKSSSASYLNLYTEKEVG